MCLTVCLVLSGGCSDVSEWPTQFFYKLNPTMTVQPYNPLIGELNEDFESDFAPFQASLTKRGVPWDEFVKAEFNALERFIVNRVPYLKDIKNPAHPSFEHFPTIEQALTYGDDCDGRAFVACSLLLYRGHLSYVVLNNNHAWVVTYLPSGAAFNILQSCNRNQWYVRWNDSALEFNFTHPMVLLVAFVFFLLILRQFPQLMTFFFKHGASPDHRESDGNESVHL